MKHHVRKEQTSRAENGKDLLFTFRNDRKAIVKAVEPLIRNDVQLHKLIGYQTWCKAINGELVWEPVANLIDELAGKAFEQPSLFCTPPEIPDSWDEFRTITRDFASSTWWHATLQPEATQSSWQSQLAKATTPRHWEDTRNKARAWRKGVVGCLATWEARVQERIYVRDIMQFRIKDMIIAGEQRNNRSVLLNEFFRLYMLREGHFQKRVFDSANLISQPFVTLDDEKHSSAFLRRWWLEQGGRAEAFEAARLKFDELLRDDFPYWRASDPPQITPFIERCVEDVGNYDNNRWQAMVEMEVIPVWNKVARKIENHRRYLRVRVPFRYPEKDENRERRHIDQNNPLYLKTPVEEAPEGCTGEEFSAWHRKYIETKLQRTVALLPKNFVSTKHKKHWQGYTFEGAYEFCWRWRDWDPDFDLTFLQLNERALIQGHKSEQDGMGEFIEPRDIEQPFEPNKDLENGGFDYKRV